MTRASRANAVLVLVIGALLYACAASNRGEAPPEFERVDADALENTIVVAPGVLSGGQPKGETGFDALAELGVRTVISVDGARPDLDAAEARGMRYVHLPIGYDGVPDDRRLTLARAIRDLPGPVYVHCHHGVHRGPAAVAAALVTLDEIDGDAGARFLEQAGTSPSYPGLFESVAESKPAAPAQLDAVSSDFPSVAEVGGMVEAMAAIDRAFDHLELLAQTDWIAPPDHPDLVAATEAAILARAMRASLDQAGDDTPDLVTRFEQSVALTMRLDARLAANDRLAAISLLPTIEADCKACHVAYRNRRP